MLEIMAFSRNQSNVPSQWENPIPWKRFSALKPFSNVKTNSVF